MATVDARGLPCENDHMITTLGAVPTLGRTGAVSAPAAAMLRTLAAKSVAARSVAAPVLARSYPQALGRAPGAPPMSRFSVAGDAPVAPPAALALALAPAPSPRLAPIAEGGGGGGGGGASAALDPRDELPTYATPPSGERGTLGASVTVPDWTILAGVAAVVGIGYLVLRRKGHV